MGLFFLKTHEKIKYMDSKGKRNRKKKKIKQYFMQIN